MKEVVNVNTLFSTLFRKVAWWSRNKCIHARIQQAALIILLTIGLNKS